LTDKLKYTTIAEMQRGPVMITYEPSILAVVFEIAPEYPETEMVLKNFIY